MTKKSDCSGDAEQSTEHKEPERDVLCRLEQHHTTAEVRARRLACLPSPLGARSQGSPRVVAITFQKNGWYIDRGVRFSLTISTFSSVRLAHVSLIWVIRNSPRMLGQAGCGNTREMMTRLADGFLRSHAKASPVASPTSIPTKSFSCGKCGKKFPTLQAASTHEWTVHKRRQAGADCINGSGRCPVCKRTFHTRLRAISMGLRSQRAEMAVLRKITRRALRHTERSLTMLTVSKLVPPGNLTSVHTDHTACELLRWFDRASCSFLLSCKCAPSAAGF